MSTVAPLDTAQRRWIFDAILALRPSTNDADPKRVSEIMQLGVQNHALAIIARTKARHEAALMLPLNLPFNQHQ